MKTTYTDVLDLSDLQISIMRFVDLWTHEQKTTVPLQEIIRQMDRDGVKRPTTISAIHGLLRKKYIRRSFFRVSNKTAFVQLRRV